MKQKHKNQSSRFSRYLLDGERALWTGKPSPWRLLSGSDLLLIPFSLMWGGFAIFWTLVASSSGVSFFTLWGMPFVIVGQYFIWGRFVHKHLSRRHTYYAITNRRVLILKSLFRRRLDSYQRNRIPIITWKGRNLLFGDDPLSQIKYGRNPWRNDVQPGLYDVPDAEDVYRLLQTQIR